MAAHLTDFGLARLSATGSRLTRTGEALGTPAYMSPEQARGEIAALTPACDVWSLGCVLYELLASGQAFPGESPAEVVGAVLTREPAALRAIRPDVPAGLDRIVRTCLAKSAGRRYASARDLRDDCARVLRGERPRACPAGARATPWRLAVAVGLLGLAGAGLWAATRPDPPPAAVAPTTDPEAARLAAQGWGERHLDVASAEARLAQALARAPERHDWRLDLGLLQWANGDHVEAATATWEGVPRSSPLWTRARWLQGLAWGSRLAETRDAASSARAGEAWGRAASGTEPEASWARAGLLLESDPARARALLGHRADWTASLLQGHVGTLAGDEAESRASIAAYTRALEEGLPLAWAYGNRGSLHAKLGDRARAIADYDAAIRCRPEGAEAYFNRGVMRGEMGDAAGALADIEAALQRRPDFAQAYVNRAIYRQAQGDLDGARADYDAAVGYGPPSAVAHYNRARLRERQGELDGAREDYDTALRLQPGFAPAYHGRGFLRASQGDSSGARDDFDAALQHDPGFADAYCNRGILRQEQGDPAGARADLDAAVRCNPDFARAFHHRALLRREAGDIEGALADFDAALRCQPDRTQAYLDRGTLRLAQGDDDGAEADLARALELAPAGWADRPPTERALRDLRASRGR